MSQSDSRRIGYQTASIEGHHNDYGEPLNVQWLCQLCHQEWHTENGRGLNATPQLMRKAHIAVKNAVLDSTLVRPDACQKCGNKRSEHVEPTIGDYEITCLECGRCFAPRRSDAKYCSGKCRRLAFSHKGIQGRVYRTQLLKSGKVSIVIHTSKADLKSGDFIRWVMDTD